MKAKNKKNNHLAKANYKKISRDNKMQVKEIIESVQTLVPGVKITKHLMKPQ